MSKDNKNHFQDLPHCHIISHRLGDHMKILQVGLELSNPKLEVLCEVVKALDMFDLRELIEECIDQHVRGLLEGSSDIGKALNKKLCTTWLKELQGEDKEKEKEEA